MAWPTTAAWHPVLPPGEPGDAAAGAEPAGEGVTEGHKGRSAAACEPGPSAGGDSAHAHAPRERVPRGLGAGQHCPRSVLTTRRAPHAAGHPVHVTLNAEAM